VVVFVHPSRGSNLAEEKLMEPSSFPSVRLRKAGLVGSALRQFQLRLAPLLTRTADAAPVALCCRECATASAVGLASAGLTGTMHTLARPPRRLLRRA
jgi:hypothetical protein